MFWFRNDPCVDGVGVAFTDAVAPDDGVLDLSAAPGSRAPAWQAVEDVLGVPIFQVHQVHGARVVRVHGGTVPSELAAEPADALVTTTRGLGLAIRVADCLPVLLADASAGVVAAAHAGRVGLAAGVLTESVRMMRLAGAVAITAWIGPHICGQCYEVPQSMRDELAPLLPDSASRTSWGTPALDLGAAAARQLQELGCLVRRQDACTRTTGSLHSFRRDGAASGRQAGIIWIDNGARRVSSTASAGVFAPQAKVGTES